MTNVFSVYLQPLMQGAGSVKQRGKPCAGLSYAVHSSSNGQVITRSWAACAVHFEICGGRSPPYFGIRTFDSDG